ncbi:uncharacterized protein [Mytilus edulis]|uniref:uncharacterized protein n=1 Tax=Mytilus edulis TaxID=6550 RepID=UPI0039F0086B
MGKTSLFVVLVAFIVTKGEANYNTCTDVYGGYCSTSKTCSSLGGNVETLPVRCQCGKPCCKCTDTCPVGSTCMSEGETCDGVKDTHGCCGNRFCCTPISTTTPTVDTTTTCGVTTCPENFECCRGRCPPGNEQEEFCCAQFADSVCCTECRGTDPGI